MKYKKIVEDKEIDKKLKELKAKYGITEAFIARRLGKSRQYIHSILKGEYAVEEKTYLMLKRFLNL